VRSLARSKRRGRCERSGGSEPSPTAASISAEPRTLREIDRVVSSLAPPCRSAFSFGALRARCSRYSSAARTMRSKSGDVSDRAAARAAARARPPQRRTCRWRPGHVDHQHADRAVACVPEVPCVSARMWRPSPAHPRPPRLRCNTGPGRQARKHGGRAGTRFRAGWSSPCGERAVRFVARGLHLMAHRSSEYAGTVDAHPYRKARYGAW
jgi:hypothetical protein